MRSNKALKNTSAILCSAVMAMNCAFAMIPASADNKAASAGTVTRVVPYNAAVSVDVPEFKQTYKPSASSIKLYWYNPRGADIYEVQRFNEKTGKWKTIVKTPELSFKDTGLEAATTYRYRIRGTITNGVVEIHSNYSDGNYTASTTMPTVSISSNYSNTVNAVRINWTAAKGVDGYRVYKFNPITEKWSKIKTIKNGDTATFRDSKLQMGTQYSYKVRAYKKIDGVTVWGGYSDAADVCTRNKINPYSSKLEQRADTAILKPGRVYKEYEAKGTKTRLSDTVRFSDDDIITLEKFASKHFTSGMTRYQKLNTTLMWINRNVKYPKKASDYYEVGPIKSAVDGVFNKKIGQCNFYNGAMAAMMTYLGYDVRIINGNYQTNTSRHTWIETRIDGKTYVVETGNADNSYPGWHHLLEKYSEMNDHYMKNGKLCCR